MYVWIRHVSHVYIVRDRDIVSKEQGDKKNGRQREKGGWGDREKKGIISAGV